MSDKAQTYFKKLTEDEAISKLNQLLNLSGTLFLWKKGEEKEACRAAKFDKKNLIIELDETKYSNEEVLLTFKIHGVQYFGKAHVNSQGIHLSVIDNLYKSERRKNFRLLTYPLKNVYFTSFIDSKEVIPSNVVSFKTKKSETGLFKNFLHIVDKDENKNALKFRILDISVSGVGLILGKFEKELLEKNPKLQNVEIDFEGDIIKVKEAKVCYLIETQNSKDFDYKAGIEFVNLSVNADSNIGKKINENLRSSEKEFEDYLK